MTAAGFFSFPPQISITSRYARPDTLRLLCITRAAELLRLGDAPTAVHSYILYLSLIHI